MKLDHHRRVLVTQQSLSLIWRDTIPCGRLYSYSETMDLMYEISREKCIILNSQDWIIVQVSDIARGSFDFYLLWFNNKKHACVQNILVIYDISYYSIFHVQWYVNRNNWSILRIFLKLCRLCKIIIVKTLIQINEFLLHWKK